MIDGQAMIAKVDQRVQAILDDPEYKDDNAPSQESAKAAIDEMLNSRRETYAEFAKEGRAASVHCVVHVNLCQLWIYGAEFVSRRFCCVCSVVLAVAVMLAVSCAIALQLSSLSCCDPYTVCATAAAAQRTNQYSSGGARPDDGQTLAEAAGTVLTEIERFKVSKQRQEDELEKLRQARLQRQLEDVRRAREREQKEREREAERQREKDAKTTGVDTFSSAAGESSLSESCVAGSRAVSVLWRRAFS